MTFEASYFVVLSHSDHFDLPALADCLSRGLGIHRLDATTHLKRSWGLIHKTDEIEKAEGLQQAFKQAGIETFVLQGSELRKPPQPKLLRKAVPESDGLAFQDEGHDRLLPWSSVILLCAGEVEEAMRVTERLAPDGKAKKWLLRTGLTPVTAVAVQYERSKIREVTKDRTESSYYLDLIAKDDDESVRILGESFDYSYLGSKMAYNAFLNFKTLALDIAKFLTHVTKNQGMRAVETQAVMKNLKYGSLDDFESEKLWLMQLNRDWIISFCERPQKWDKQHEQRRTPNGRKRRQKGSDMGDALPSDSAVRIRRDTLWPPHWAFGHLAHQEERLPLCR